MAPVEKKRGEERPGEGRGEGRGERKDGFHLAGARERESRKRMPTSLSLESIQQTPKVCQIG